MSITISPHEATLLITWYRCAHHLDKCTFPIKKCHNLRAKLQTIRDETTKVRFGQVKFRNRNYVKSYCELRIKKLGENNPAASELKKLVSLIDKVEITQLEKEAITSPNEKE